jgi:hypothetical protein
MTLQYPQAGLILDDMSEWMPDDPFGYCVLPNKRAISYAIA